MVKNEVTGFASDEVVARDVRRALLMLERPIGVEYEADGQYIERLPRRLQAMCRKALEMKLLDLLAELECDSDNEDVM